MNKKLAIRTILLLFTIAVIVVAYQVLQKWSVDYGGGSAESVGMIAALEETNNGTRVVAIETSGNKKELPGVTPETRDIDFSWGGDGSHIYLSTNRDPLRKSNSSGSFNIFRWKVGSGEVEPLTDQRRTISAPRFGRGKEGNWDNSKIGIAISGGRVLEFIPSSTKSTLAQVMPPIDKDRVSGGEGEGQSEGGSVYTKYGNSFRQAFYLPGHESMLAVMSRDDGEVLIFHDFRLDQEGRPRPPIGLLAGSRIQLDVAEDGHFVICQQDATATDRENPPRDWMKEGKLFPNLGGQPFHHMMWYGKIEASGVPAPTPIAPATIKPDEEVEFIDPKLSPDGSALAVVIARRDQPQATVPQGLLLIPLSAKGAEQPKPLVQGMVGQPSWSPDGKNIVFTMLDGQYRSIFEMSADGSNPRKVAGDANFSFPQYSPQVKKSS